MVVEFARHARHELAAYVTIGVILGVIGVIGSVRYSRGGGNSKHSGRLACSTQVLSCKYHYQYCYDKKPNEKEQYVPFSTTYRYITEIYSR